MSNPVDRIIDWLKANGSSSLEGKCFSFSCNDEPFMKFSAEWQDWDGREMLYVGYSSIVNGDVCYEPLYVFEIKEGEFTQITCDNWMVGPRQIGEEEDVLFVMNCLNMFYARHMASRGNVQEV